MKTNRLRLPLCLLLILALPLCAQASGIPLPQSVSQWAADHPAPDYEAHFASVTTPDMRMPDGAPSALSLDPQCVTGPFLLYSTERHILEPAPDTMTNSLPDYFYANEHWESLAEQNAPLVYIIAHPTEDMVIGHYSDGSIISVSNHQIYVIDEAGTLLGFTNVQTDETATSQITASGMRYQNNNPFRTYLEIINK